MWEYRAAPIRALDGDTVRLLVDTGFHGRHEVDIRLADVAAPELDEPGGQEILDFVEWWMIEFSRVPSPKWPFRVRTQTTATPEPTERRSFTRYVGDVYAIDGGSHLNALLREKLAQT